jgi:hypothetical protein
MQNMLSCTSVALTSAFMRIWIWRRKSYATYAKSDVINLSADVTAAYYNYYCLCKMHVSEKPT